MRRFRHIAAAVLATALVASAPASAINVGVPSTGVGLPGSWWGNGYTGGTADIGILEDYSNHNHPWLAGVNFVEPPGQLPTGMNHGTSVTSVAVGNDPNEIYRGIAYGVEKVLDADNFAALCPGGSASEELWSLGIDHRCNWGSGPLVEGADQDDRAEALSWAAGNSATIEDPADLWFDSLISIYGVGISAAAGNEGPGAETTTEFCNSYNTLCMGATDDEETTSRADDTIYESSSWGPVIGTNRKKPDLVAPGESLAVANYQCSSPGCPDEAHGASGTSLSAPMGAGALVILAGAGITDYKAQKAILINSADGIGAQTTWQADAGWGQLAMDTAYLQKDNYATGTIAEGQSKFYSANLAVGDRATITWHRRVVFDSIPPNAQTPKTIYPLTNLDLTQYSTGQAQRDTSSTSDNNVEQVTSPNTENAIYKVKAASSVQGASTQPYAIAASKDLTELDAPTVDQAVAQGATEAQQATDVTITSDIENTSNDLTAGAVTADIDLPSGVTLTGGSDPQPLGTLGPNDSAQAQWTVQGTTDGLKQITIDAQGSSFGETWSSSKNLSLLVDSTGPTTSFGSLGTYANSNPVTVPLASSDGSGTGVNQTEVEVSANFGAWSPHTTLSAGQDSFTFTGVEGVSYRFRSRATDDLGNTGEWSESSTTTIDTQAPALSLYALPTSAFGQTISIWVAASDVTSGVASRTYSIDGGAVHSFTGDVISISGLAPGSHTVSVSVSDTAGHINTRAASFTVLGVTVDPEPKKRSRVGKLRIKRRGRKITVRGTITKGVAGKVRITAKFYGKKPRSKKLRRKIKKATKTYAKIKKQQFRKTLTVPTRGRYKVVAKFRGNDVFEASKRTRRVRVK